MLLPQHLVPRGEKNRENKTNALDLGVDELFRGSEQSCLGFPLSQRGRQASQGNTPSLVLGRSGQPTQGQSCAESEACHGSQVPVVAFHNHAATPNKGKPLQKISLSIMRLCKALRRALPKSHSLLGGGTPTMQVPQKGLKVRRGSKSMLPLKNTPRL